MVVRQGPLENLVMGFWSGKRVLVTGHTGFKGGWLSLWLSELGASVSGLALEPDTEPALFDQLGLASRLDHRIGDIRDCGLVQSLVSEVAPDIVLHLAAQPLVLASYDDPVDTWSTNVMGSVHVLQALRTLGRPCAAVMVTTDKVYENRDWVHPYREGDPLGGHDPYSASKAAMEMAVTSWRRSFPGDGRLRIATARAGNVIGGGDWAANRIFPDLARALAAGLDLKVRNPASVRPWQHVLEPLAGYLRLARALYLGEPVAATYNFGPEPGDLACVGDLVDMALGHWPGHWSDVSAPGAPHEAARLSLGIEAARADLGYVPRWALSEAVARTVSWYRDVHAGESAAEITLAQIRAFGAP